MKKFIALIMIFMLFACSLSVSAATYSEEFIRAELECEWDEDADSVIYEASEYLEKQAYRIDGVDNLYVCVNEKWAGTDTDFKEFLENNYYNTDHELGEFEYSRSKNSIAIVSSGDRTEIYAVGTARDLLSDEDIEWICARFGRGLGRMKPDDIADASRQFAKDCRRTIASNRRALDFDEAETAGEYIAYCFKHALPVTLGAVLGPVVGAVLTVTKLHAVRLRRRTDRIGRYRKTN